LSIPDEGYSRNLHTKFDIYVFLTFRQVLEVMAAARDEDSEQLADTMYRIAKIGYSHLCLREENLSFINNYMI
jgi:hypothetical protein